MEKFVLSPHYRFIEKDEYEKLPAADAQRLQRGEIYALMEQQNGSVLLLNPSIQQFLSCFQSPIDSESVVKHYMTLTNRKFDDIKKILTPFFHDMFDKGILVSDKTVSFIHKLKPLSIGDTLKDFTLTETLSEKGVLKIYKAQRDMGDLSMSQNSTVVLKVLDLNTLESQSEKKYWTKRFQQEISILQEAQAHPSVCRHLETFKTENKTVLVLENIEGGSIKKWIKQNASVSLGQKKFFLSQILEVYAFFHKNGILHGDIHQSNILITKDLRIKIIDFDMSYHYPLRKGEIVIEGGVEGYLPPENISDNFFDMVNDCSNFRSEVYQLGVIAYSIFYEKMPFEAEKWKDLAKMIRTENPQMGLFTVTPSHAERDGANGTHRDDDGANAPSSQRHDKSVKGGVDSFILRCLDKNPKNRFASAIEMNEYWQQWK